jgi:hypothetical protein
MILAKPNSIICKYTYRSYDNIIKKELVFTFCTALELYEFEKLKDKTVNKLVVVEKRVESNIIIYILNILDIFLISSNNVTNLYILILYYIIG